MLKKIVNKNPKKLLIIKKLMWFLVIIFTITLSSLITYYITISIQVKEIGGKVVLVQTQRKFPILVNIEDNYEGELLRNYGVFREHVAKVITKLVKEGDICIDIGAGYGYHTILMSNIVGSKGMVIGYEVIPEIFELLNYSVRMNNDIATKVYKNILYSQHIEGLLEVFKEYPTVSTFYVASKKRRGNQANFREVVAEKLDTIYPNLSNVSLINIRTNGTEMAIIRGAKEIIARSPRISIIVPWNSSKFAAYGDGYLKLIDSFVNAKFEFWLIKLDGSLKLIQKDQLINLDRVDVLISRRDLD